MRARHGLPRRPSLSASREPHDPRGGSPRSFAPDSRPARPGRPARWVGGRPSLLLWRHRHLVVALCLGTAVLVALSVLRPGPQRGQQVLVASRTISAGALLTDRDVSISTLPIGALPQSPLTSTEQAVGSRAAISLEKGTVLTASMTSGSLAQQLGDDERLVQVAIDVGTERPGEHLDNESHWKPRRAFFTNRPGITRISGVFSEHFPRNTCRAFRNSQHSSLFWSPSSDDSAGRRGWAMDRTQESNTYHTGYSCK